jgi:hypothetical protein
MMMDFERMRMKSTPGTLSGRVKGRQIGARTFTICTERFIFSNDAHVLNGMVLEKLTTFLLVFLVTQTAQATKQPDQISQRL